MIINCPECGKEISDKAKFCPNCGYPISEDIARNENAIENDIEKEINEKEIQKIEEILEIIPNNDKLSIIKKLSENAKISLKRAKKVVDYYFENANYNVCLNCGTRNKKDSIFCCNCSYRMLSPYGFSVDFNNTESENSTQKRQTEVPIEKEKTFQGIYKYTLFGGKQEVYCPRCGSQNCSHYQEQKIIPGKTKTRYTANLNPLHPFTLVNKKEKVKKKEQVVTESKFICNSCGKIFN